MKRTTKYSQFSNKQNINPNIMLPSTQQPKSNITVNYPKVSCFGVASIDQHDTNSNINNNSNSNLNLNFNSNNNINANMNVNSKDWRKRIMTLSDRQRALNNKLLRMLQTRISPIKNIDKLPTQAASLTSNAKYSQKLGNTLRRYLYQYSQSNSNSNSHSHSRVSPQQNITFIQSNINANFNFSQMIDQLHKIVEQVTGVQVQIYNMNNPEQVVSGVIQALKQYNSKNKQQVQKNKAIVQKSNVQIQIDMD